MRFLAIDPGRRRTGLAVGDDVTGVVTPLAVLTAGGVDACVRQIAGAVREQAPAELVVGLPLNMDGSESEGARQARRLAEAVGAATGLTVHLHDERLTSAAADELLAEQGLTRKRRKGRRDALAAATILIDFLASRARPGKDDGAAGT